MSPLRRLRGTARRGAAFVTVTAGSLVMLATPALAATTPAKENSGNNLLPVYRWRGAASGFYTNYGAGDFAKSAIVSLATLPFALSNFLWGLLMALMDFATGMSIVTRMTTRVDDTFAVVGKALIGDGEAGGRQSGIVIVLVLGIVFAVFQGVRGGARAAFRGVLMTVLPALALMTLVTNAANHSSMSPGNMAVKASSIVGDAGGAAIKGLTIKDNNPKTLGTPCENYSTELYSRYTKPSNAGKINGNGSETGEDKIEVPDTYAAAIPAVASRMWEASVYQAWVQVQFGSNNESGPGHAACRFAESRSGVSSAAQADIMTDAIGWPDCTGGGAGQGCQRALGPAYPDGRDEMRRFMIGWATCTWAGGGPSIDPEWTWVKNYSGEPGGSDDSAKAGACTDMANGDSKPEPGKDGPFQYKTKDGFDHATTASGHDSPDAREYLYALNGHNITYGLAAGFLALISTAIIMWALGGMAVGTVISQFVLVLGLCISPLLLLAAAIPSQTTRRLAMTGLRLIGAAVISRVVFLFVMGLLLILIKVFDGMAPAESGTIVRLVWQMLTTIGSVFFLRTLLKKAGLGNIMSFKGAMMTTAALGNSAIAPQGRGIMSQLKNEAVRGVGRGLGYRAVDKVLGGGRDKGDVIMDTYGMGGGATATMLDDNPEAHLERIANDSEAATGVVAEIDDWAQEPGAWENVKSTGRQIAEDLELDFVFANAKQAIGNHIARLGGVWRRWRGGEDPAAAPDGASAPEYSDADATVDPRGAAPIDIDMDDLADAGDDATTDATKVDKFVADLSHALNHWDSDASGVDAAAAGALLGTVSTLRANATDPAQRAQLDDLHTRLAALAGVDAAAETESAAAAGDKLDVLNGLIDQWDQLHGERFTADASLHDELDEQIALVSGQISDLAKTSIDPRISTRITELQSKLRIPSNPSDQRLSEAATRLDKAIAHAEANPEDEGAERLRRSADVEYSKLYQQRKRYDTWAATPHAALDRTKAAGADVFATSATDPTKGGPAPVGGDPADELDKMRAKLEEAEATYDAHVGSISQIAQREIQLRRARRKRQAPGAEELSLRARRRDHEKERLRAWTQMSAMRVKLGLPVHPDAPPVVDDEETTP